MSITQISIQLIGLANSLIDMIVAIPTPLISIAGFVIFACYPLFRKLRGFRKPDSPLFSPVLREVSSYGEVICLIAIVLIVLFSMTLVLLVVSAFIFSAATQQISFLNVIENALRELWRVTETIYVPLAISSMLGMFFGLYTSFISIPLWERGKGLTDVRRICNKFSRMQRFNPYPYFDMRHGCFIGKDENHKALYVPWTKLRETHVQVIGATGSGKGVITSCIGYQAALAGEGLVWIDPKNDRFAPKLMMTAARRANKKFYFLNLNPGQPAQFNLLEGAQSHEIEELLVSGFDLKGKGTDGDYHRGKDEDAAIAASRFVFPNESISIQELISRCGDIQSITDQENFWRKLGKLGSLSCIQTRGGVSLPQAIAERAVIYVIGSTDNERVVMLQKMLLVRIHQIIKAHDRVAGKPPVCLVLDEFKFLLSPVALAGLSVIRDFDAHVILAHQSLGDLDCCAGISRSEAEGVVLDNTAIKIIFRQGDSTYAERLSKASGKTRVYAESVSKSIDGVALSDGSWRETQVPLVDADVLTHLSMPSDSPGQATVGVLLGVGLAKVFYIGPVPVSGQSPEPIKAPPLNIRCNKEDLI